VVRRERVDAERVVVGQQRQDVVDPALHVRLPHPQLDLLVEQLDHRQWVGGAAVDARQRDRPAAADDVDRREQRGEAVDARLLDQRLRDRVGQEPGEPLRQRADRRAVRLHPDRVDDGVRSAAAGELPRHVAEILAVLVEVERLDAAAAGAREAVGHAIDADHAPALMDRDARGHVADRAKPQDEQGPAVRHARVLHRLPCGRQHVGEEQVAVVRRALGDLDRQEVPERDAQELRLAARDLAVELRVSEQGRAGAVLVDLGGLALRVQTFAAHPAVPAGDVERDHDAVADRQLGDAGARLLHDAHRLVAEDVALVDERPEDLVEVQVGAAQARRRDPDDHVVGILDARIGDVVDADVLDPVVRQRLHARPASLRSFCAISAMSSGA
jgi:hypothetical protein